MATASALLHLPLLGAGPSAALPAAAGLACLVCAVHLWRRPGLAAWAGHVAVAALMAGHGLTAGHADAHAHAGAAAGWAPPVLLPLAGLGVLLGAVRWAVGTDVALRGAVGPGREPVAAQMPAAGGRSGRRVPQA